MDARMQKHRKKRWQERWLFVVLSFVVSWETQALVEPVPPISSIWCSSLIANWFDIPPRCIYDTALAAAQAAAADYNSVYLAAGRGWSKLVVTGCDATGTCTFYQVWPYWEGAARIPSIHRTVQNNFTITLQGGTTIEPATLLPFNAVVQDQNGVAQSGKQVTITVDVTNGTGGHIHTDNRPKGIFTCSSALGASPASCTLTTDGRGQASFEFVATPISGTHTITATCNGCSNTETKSVNVKVSGLIPIPAAPQLYALQDSAGTVIGAVAGKHTANHYLTATAIGKLEELATLYKTSINPKVKLYLNDASLTWGGLFDVGSNTPWASPHSTHDKGRSLDIRAANSGPNVEGAVPSTLFSEFIDKSRRKGFKMGLHCKNSSDTNYCLGQPNNRHFHVDF